MAERKLAPTWPTTAGLAVLTLNSGLGLAIYRSWGYQYLSSVIFFAYLDLLLLFAYLGTYLRTPPGSPARERATRAVVGGLHTMALGVMACDSALAVHDARGDLVSAGAVLLAYAALLALTLRFLRAFAGCARGVRGEEQDQGRCGGAENDDVH